MAEDFITRKVVVGVDESEGAAAALQWAAEEADVHQASVTAVMAWGLLDQHHVGEGEKFDPRYDKEAATVALAEYVRRALGDDRAEAVSLNAVCDLSPRTLLEASADADLTVVGARGLGGFRGLLLGSVSQHCLHNTNTPIAIIRSDRNQHRPSGCIVVAVDGSPTSRRALQWSLAEARARDAMVEAVYAWEVPYSGYPPYGTVSPVDVNAYEQSAQRVLEQALSDVSAADTERIRPVLVRGVATQALLNASETADLLVAGTRGHSALKRLVLGSVATQLSHHSRCPLVVVPPAPEPEL